MKNILKYKTFVFTCLISIVSLLVITSCDSDDELSTSQMGGTSAVTLKSYGPTPALRGGELRFIGDNVNQVTAVVIPGAGEITEFTKKEETEIRIIIPQNAAVGYPSLITPQGEIKAKTLLSFEEPISITSITTAKVKAGDKFTIEGDYLNLVKVVVFQQDAEVSEDAFLSHTREKIEVIVPVEARSGVLKVTNGAEIPIEVYSGDLEASVTEPAITALSPLSIKAGNSLTITGSDLDLIAAVVFGGEKEVTAFTVNESASQITVTVPEDAEDGAVRLIAKSDLEYTSEESITLAVPADLTVSPAANIRAGDEITITGKDLDLVTSLLFTGMTEPVAPASKTAAKLTVSFPEAAQSGDILLNLNNGKTVPVKVATKKPLVSAYNPSPVTAGGTLTIQGSDLDLVTSITFAGDVSVEVAPASATELLVKVPAVGAVTGKPVFTMKNGETAEVLSLEIISPLFCFIPVLPDTNTEEILAGNILVVGVENGDKLTKVLVDGVETQHILKGSQLSILVPENAGGNTPFTLVSSNGEVVYTINITPLVPPKDILWEGSVGPCDWSGSHTVPVDVSRLIPGKTLGFDIECSSSTDYWQLRIMGGWWGGIPTLVGKYGSAEYTISFTASDTNFEFPIAQGDIDIIQQEGGILIFAGNGVIIKSVYVK